MTGWRILLTLAVLTLLSGPAPAQDPPRVLAIGDSLFAGDGLQPGEAILPVLSGWLAAQGIDATIDNAGVSGETTAGGLERLPVDRLNAADAVIVELGGNDMLMELPPAVAETNLDAILTRAGADGRPVLLVGIMARPTDPPAKQQAWAEIWPRLAERHDAVLMENLYAPLLALPLLKQLGALQRDGIHPSSAGVRAIVEGLGPRVAELLERVDQ